VKSLALASLLCLLETRLVLFEIVTRSSLFSVSGQNTAKHAHSHSPKTELVSPTVACLVKVKRERKLRELQVRLVAQSGKERRRLNESSHNLTAPFDNRPQR
jgi:hypothetical protein